MIQDQLVEYINAQTKLGVSRDTIKSTLVGAGWVAADVDDTFKKIDSQKASQPIAGVSAAPSIAALASNPAPATFGASATGPASAATVSGPQILKVSDLVSSSSAAAVPTSSSSFKDVSPKSPLTGPAAAKPAALAPNLSKDSNTFQSTAYSPKSHSSHGALIVDIVLVIIILGVGGVAGYLFMQNSSLNTQLKSIEGQSSGVTALQSQLAASTTALSAQNSSLGSEAQELQTELSFYVAPSSTVPGATTTLSISDGVVSGGGKTPYAITATYGGKVYVANSKDVSVIAALSPIVGTTSQQFSGSYAPGSDEMTLSTVNSTTVQ